jgi:hypothetical protein
MAQPCPSREWRSSEPVKGADREVSMIIQVEKVRVTALWSPKMQGPQIGCELPLPWVNTDRTG